MATFVATKCLAVDQGRFAIWQCMGLVGDPVARGLTVHAVNNLWIIFWFKEYI